MAARIGGELMTMPSDAPRFDVRATFVNGTRHKLGLYATHADAAELARWAIATGDVTRVDIVRRGTGHTELVAVISPSRPAPWRWAIDRR
jgi:hypothetical protein